MSALIEFDAVCKYYQMGDTTVKAADHITMKIEKGEFVAIVGQSDVEVAVGADTLAEGDMEIESGHFDV